MYQSVDQVPENDLDEPILTRPKRNKGPSRCYNIAMIVVYSALLLMAVVTLGLFGVKEAQIVDRVRVLHNSTGYSCILYATYADTDTNGDIHLDLHSTALCGYVFWGLASITIVACVWLVYSIVQVVVGPKILSPLRILDLVVILLTFLLSLAVSSTIDVGLNQTCEAFVTNKKEDSTCLEAYLVKVPDKGQKQLKFYDEINTAKSSSWVTTVTLIALTLWHTILAISYCCVVSHRRKVNRLIQENECDSQQD